MQNIGPKNDVDGGDDDARVAVVKVKTHVSSEACRVEEVEA